MRYNAKKDALEGEYVYFLQQMTIFMLLGLFCGQRDIQKCEKESTKSTIIWHIEGKIDPNFTENPQKSLLDS